MRSVTYRLEDLNKITLDIGFVGENEHTVINFDSAKLFEEYPDAVAALTVVSPSGEAYPAVTVRDGDIVSWTVKDSDLVSHGNGELQLTFTEGTTVAKSYSARTKVNKSIEPTGEVPTPVEQWMVDANTALAEVEEAKKAFPAGGSTGQVLTKKSDEDYDTDWETPQGGGGGTSNYNDLDNKPSINGVTLSGNKSLSDLSIPSQEDVVALSEAITKKTEKSISASASGWRLNESDGLCSESSGYSIVKYTVTAGDIVKVVSDDRFQFQTVASVPSYGTSNRVGQTYGEGTFILTVPETATYLIFSTPSTGSIAKAYDCEMLSDVVDELAVEIASEDQKIEDRTTYPTTNIYDPSKQTSDTISPHYYVNGVPYSTTQFDGSWNCTAPIPVKPSTDYVIGLVPAVDDSIVKPWNSAGYGWFAYDANGNYISQGSNNAFTTPGNAAYIRFNYYIALDKVSLDVLNQRCVIVEGDELPENYIAYSQMTIKEKIDTIGGRVNYVIHDDGEGVTLIAKYNALKDIAITLEKKGGNDLFDFYSFGLIGNPSKDISRTADSQTIFLSTGSDWFAPFVVKALNNIDGDSTESDTFTGGNHQYNNTGSGSTPTARGTALVFKADNRAVTSGNGNCSRFEMDWTNLVQATNTKKVDGTGREVLQENHRLIFDGERFEFFVDLIPLEDVKMMVWYGAQWTWEAGQNTPYPKVRYIGATDRAEHSCESASSESGDNTCCHVVGYGNDHEIRLDIDDSYDLGDHKYYPNNATKAIFTETYGKGYCNFFNVDNLDEDDMYSLHGWYQFKSRT